MTCRDCHERSQTDENPLLPAPSGDLRFVRFLTLIMVSFFVWREWRARSIPDVGAPFDVEAFLEENNDQKRASFAVEFTDHEDKPVIDSFVLSAAWSRDCSREHALDRFFHFDKQLNLVHLALQRHHRKQCKFPDRLEDLVPDYLARIPTNLKRKGDKFTFSPTAEDGRLFISDSEFRFQVLRPRCR